jgi:nitrate reductase NapAB chaperone NapD
MAIMGFLVHVLADHAQDVERDVAAMPEMTTYGVHNGTHIVVVAEAPAESMEGLLARIKSFPGVLNCYISSMTVEDQMDDA